MPTMATKLSEELTIGIKHTSRFARRRFMLAALLQSIRDQYGYAVRVLVADDGGMAKRNALLGAELIERIGGFAGLPAHLVNGRFDIHGHLAWNQVEMPLPSTISARRSG